MEFMSTKTIILTSNEPWGDVWFSKQHYANELSKLGYAVFFLNPTLRWSWGNIFSFKIKTNKVNEFLTIIDYKNNFPQQILFPRLFVLINDLLNCQKIKTQILKTNKQLIWWKFDPYRFLTTPGLNKGKTIYHVVDPHLHLWQNKIQAKNADLIVCTSNKYVDYYKDDGCQNVIQIPHGISEDEFKLDSDRVEMIYEEYGDFVIVVGTIAHDVDINLFKRIAEEKINLLIIGREIIVSDGWEVIKNLKNVHFIGQLHAKELKNYVSAAKAGLITYNFTPKQKHQIGRSPLKVLNYLAQKIPIITSVSSDLDTLNNEVVYRAYNSEEFISFVKRAMGNNLFVNSDKIEHYLQQHSYPRLINTIFYKLKSTK
jgi:hypothetical protein